MRYEERCLRMRKQKMNFWHVFALSFEITGLRHIFLKLPSKDLNILTTTNKLHVTHWRRNWISFTIWLGQYSSLVHNLTRSIFKFGSQSDSVNIQAWFTIWLGQYSILIKVIESHDNVRFSISDFQVFQMHLDKLLSLYFHRDSCWVFDILKLLCLIYKVILPDKYQWLKYFYLGKFSYLLPFSGNI